MSLKVAPVIFVVYPVDKEGSFGTLRNASEQQLAERVGFEPTWRLSPPIRFRVGAVMAASVPLQRIGDYILEGGLFASRVQLRGC